MTLPRRHSRSQVMAACAAFAVAPHQLTPNSNPSIVLRGRPSEPATRRCPLLQRMRRSRPLAAGTGARRSTSAVTASAPGVWEVVGTVHRQKSCKPFKQITSATAQRGIPGSKKFAFQKKPSTLRVNGPTLGQFSGGRTSECRTIRTPVRCRNESLLAFLAG